MHGFPSLGRIKKGLHPHSTARHLCFHMFEACCGRVLPIFHTCWTHLNSACVLQNVAFSLSEPFRAFFAFQSLTHFGVGREHPARSLKLSSWADPCCHKPAQTEYALQGLTVPYSTNRMTSWIRSKQINCKMRKSSLSTRSTSLHQDRRFQREAPLSARQLWMRITTGISALGFDSSPT